MRLAFLSALLLFLAGCMGDGAVDCTGTIVTAEGKPVAGARVHATELQDVSGLDSKSLPDGSFTVGALIAPGRYWVAFVVDAPGFKPLHFEVPTLLRNHARIVLAPAGSAEEGSIDLASTDRGSEIDQDETAAAAQDVEEPREFILPASVRPVSDAKPNFGIDLEKLSTQEATVVVDAWVDYQRVLAGKSPDCPSTFGLSDGGSTMFDCGSYKLMRIRGLSEDVDKPGFNYGPSLDFLNGNTVERIRFMTSAELKKLEEAAR